MRIDEFHSRSVPQGEERDPLTEAAIGALIEVHRELGPGLTEDMHEQAVCPTELSASVSASRRLHLT